VLIQVEDITQYVKQLLLKPSVIRQMLIQIEADTIRKVSNIKAIRN